MGQQDAVMDYEPNRVQAQRVASGRMVQDRRRNLERKLSEYSGYALLFLCVAMMAGGVFLLIR
jgi:hypothetical protein